MISSTTNEGARFTVSKTDQEQDKDYCSKATAEVDQTIREENIPGIVRKGRVLCHKVYGILLCLQFVLYQG